jgi:rhodanese-related sulfurtransferase
MTMAKHHAPEFVALVDAAKAHVKEITVDEVLARGQGIGALVLVDVREDGEWQAGRAAGAMHLGRGVIERDIVGKIPDKAAPLVLYCGGGFRSALAAESIQKMGYTNVRSMAGGWSAWLERGGPTEK